MRRLDSSKIHVGLRYRYGRLLGALAGLALLGVAQQGHAATIRVDNDACTLSDAIVAANEDATVGGCTAGAGEDTIVLPRSSSVILNAPYEDPFNPGTSYGLPAIESVVTIEGNGSTIARDESATAFGIVLVSAGELTLNDTTVTGAVGPGVSARYGSLRLNDCVITSNTGTVGGTGGIEGYDSDVHLNRTTVSGNTNAYGVVAQMGGSLLVENSTIVENDHDGLQGYWTEVRVEDTTVAYNGGRGVSGHWVTVHNSTVTGNLDTGVMGWYYWLEIVNSVVAGNHGTLGREARFYHDYAGVPDDFELDAWTSNNVFGHDGDAGVYQFALDATDIVPTGPLSSILEPELRANGGPTPTFLLRANSPARDAGAASACSAEDQRGVPRPQGAACDIGAVELMVDPCATAVPSAGCTVNGVANQRCLGTSGNDTIIGTMGDDVIVASSGDDVVWARAGNDVICGGEGDDALHGGGGTDLISGGLGADSLSGDPGSDSLDGGPGANTCGSDASDVNQISCY